MIARWTSEQKACRSVAQRWHILCSMVACGGAREFGAAIEVKPSEERSQYDVTRIENNNGSRRNSSLGGRTGWKAGNRRGYRAARRKGRFGADRFSGRGEQPAAQANFLGRLFQNPTWRWFTRKRRPTARPARSANS